jgi:mono/diheme cytochrome c family protein
MKNWATLLGVIAATTAVTAFHAKQHDPWKVPEKFQAMKNPVKADNASVQAGREIYKTHCTACHGLNGKGAGRRAINLSATPADFTTTLFQKQTDGALLYKVYFGHSEMPGFKKKFPGNEGISEDNFGKTRIPGDLINYLRSYGKK